MLMLLPPVQVGFAGNEAAKAETTDEECAEPMNLTNKVGHRSALQLGSAGHGMLRLCFACDLVMHSCDQLLCSWVPVRGGVSLGLGLAGVWPSLGFVARGCATWIVEAL